MKRKSPFAIRQRWRRNCPLDLGGHISTGVMAYRIAYCCRVRGEIPAGDQQGFRRVAERANDWLSYANKQYGFQLTDSLKAELAKSYQCDCHERRLIQLAISTARQNDNRPGWWNGELESPPNLNPILPKSILAAEAMLCVFLIAMAVTFGHLALSSKPMPPTIGIALGVIESAALLAITTILMRCKASILRTVAAQTLFSATVSADIMVATTLMFLALVAVFNRRIDGPDIAVAVIAGLSSATIWFFPFLCDLFIEKITAKSKTKPSKRHSTTNYGRKTWPWITMAYALLVAGLICAGIKAPTIEAMKTQPTDWISAAIMCSGAIPLSVAIAIHRRRR